jgi:hypothetical protein
VLTARVVTGCEEDTTGGLAKTNDMAGSWGGENAVVADDELLDTVRGADLCGELDDLGVPVTAVTTDNKG